MLFKSRNTIELKYINNPIIYEPLDPIKTLASPKLKKRNTKIEASIERQSIKPNEGLSELKININKKKADEKKVNDPSSPFIPSIKLYAFVKKIKKIILKATLIG